MRFKMALLAALLVVGSAGSAWAQQPGTRGIELTPLFGYRWGGSMGSITGIRDFDTKDNISYGVGLAKRLPRNSSTEINWTHFEGDITAKTNGGLPLSGPTLKRDDIMLSGYWYAFDPSRPLIPYFTLGIGCSIFGTDQTETVGRFAWDIGLGFRKELNEKFALSVQSTWIPTWVTTGTGVWCDPFFCYSVGTGEYYDQIEVAGRLSIKL
jgi:hypothetical protein